MKSIMLTISILLFSVSLPFADDYIYDSPYGGKKIGRVNDGFVYDSPYGGKKVGRIGDNGKLYDKPHGGKPVGRYEDGKVYAEPYGGAAIGRTERKDGSGYWLLQEKREENKKQ